MYRNIKCIKRKFKEYKCPSYCYCPPSRNPLLADCLASTPHFHVSLLERLRTQTQHIKCKREDSSAMLTCDIICINAWLCNDNLGLPGSLWCLVYTHINNDSISNRWSNVFVLEIKRWINKGFLGFACTWVFLFAIHRNKKIRHHSICKDFS